MMKCVFDILVLFLSPIRWLISHIDSKYFPFIFMVDNQLEEYFYELLQEFFQNTKKLLDASL